MSLLFFRNCSSTDASIIKQDYQYKISTATGVGKMKVTYLGLQFHPVVFSINEWLRIVQMNVKYPRTQFQHILKVILVINPGISIPSGLPGNFKVLLNKKKQKVRVKTSINGRRGMIVTFSWFFWHNMQLDCTLLCLSKPDQWDFSSFFIAAAR